MKKTGIKTQSLDHVIQDIKKWFKDENITNKTVQIQITPQEKGIGSKLIVELIDAE